MNKYILLVDDDSDDRELFREAISSAATQLSFKEAEDGTEAFRMLNSSPDNLPEVIFLDINLPIISGWECLTRIKSDDVLKNIPVIIYSTSSHDRDIKIAYELGALSFVTKPHTYTDLIVLIKKIAVHIQNNTLKEFIAPVK
jgi:CheY-like chemotaxis protein